MSKTVLPPGVKKGVQGEIEYFTNQRVKIRNVAPLSGGDINAVFKVESTAGDFCVKINAPGKSSMFLAESDGLTLLREVQAIIAPEPYSIGGGGEGAFLLMEYLPPEPPGPGFMEQFGRQLARLHRSRRKRFGLHFDNFIGSLPQDNSVAKTWPDFFAERRLRPQFRMAFNAGKLGASDEQALERLIKRLPEIFPKEPPALLHGDLWSGNFLCTTGNAPALIDPAVYYGHREMDLAFSRLFGGFSPEFYSAYNEAFPLAPGAEERVDICNLYPLLVHVNLFGGSYAAQVGGILSRF